MDLLLQCVGALTTILLFHIVFYLFDLKVTHWLSEVTQIVGSLTGIVLILNILIGFNKDS